MIFWIVKIITFIPICILFPTRVIGKKNLPKGRYILVCNHMSNIDYAYLFNFIWKKQYVLAKDSLFRNRIIGGFFKACGGISVNRDNVGINTIKNCLRVLKNNKILTIFPEGTRNKTDAELLEFKAGASILAIKSNAPIVPVFITKKPKIFHINKIVIGKPMYFNNDYMGENGTNKANEEVKEAMLKLKNQ